MDWIRPWTGLDWVLKVGLTDSSDAVTDHQCSMTGKRRAAVSEYREVIFNVTHMRDIHSASYPQWDGNE